VKGARASERRTRIVSTVGPATASPETLRSLLEAGTDVVRLNFSHGTREGHGRVVETVRAIERDLGRPVAVLQDLAGPRVRVGEIAGGEAVLRPGDRFVLTARGVPGSADAVSVTHAGLPDDVRRGDEIFLSDGTIGLVVDAVEGRDVVCRVTAGGTLLSHKGVNVPGRALGVPALTERDRADLAYGVEHGVDFVGLSFVRDEREVEEARRLVAAAGGAAGIVAKIEKRAALERIDAIVAAADAVMVARGDLGVELPIEDVPGTQKALIALCNRAARPVITATQMLESMVRSARPTRAEATDVANAILDGTDAVMLSAETASGEHPVASVETMSRLAVAAERLFDRSAHERRLAGKATPTAEEAIARAACAAADDVGAAAVVPFTQSGTTARLVVRQRPAQPVLALSPDAATRRRLSLVWGVRAVEAPALERIDEVEREAVRAALAVGAARAGDRIVITAGHPLLVRGNTNLIKVAVVRG
jgi:pyruvate kinase